MKFSLPLIAVTFLFVLGLPASRALAQVTPASPTASASGLTPEEKAKYMKLRQQVLDSSPDLKAEGDALKQQAQSLKGEEATPQQKADLMKKLQDHQQKMKATMLKIDPTMGPIIDKAEAAMKERFKQRASGN